MPQPLTKAGIANLALTLIGQKPIPAADTAWTTTTEAIKVKAVWDAARLATLRAHAWKFARQRIELTAVTTDTYPGFTYIWSYPANMHLIRKVFVDTDSPNPDPIEYAQFNGKTTNTALLATNEVDDDGKCWAETTFTSEDKAGEGGDDLNYLNYDPLFVTAFAAYIGFLLAPILSDDKNAPARMMAMFDKSISDAKNIDVGEERIKSTRKAQSDFITARS